MDIEVKIGLFDYGAGELTLGKDAFSLRTAVFVLSKGGGCKQASHCAVRSFRGCLAIGNDSGRQGQITLKNDNGEEERI